MYEVVRALLTNGANPNLRDCQGFMPLHCCATADVAALLVAFGADLEARDTPFLSWMLPNSPVSPKLLRWGAARARTRVRNHRGETLLHRCRTVADAEALRTRSASAGDFELELNARDDEGCKPLHRVVARAFTPRNYLVKKVVQLVHWLLEHDANPRTINKRGETPLHLARFEDLSRLFVAAGASLEARDRAGCTPAERARSRYSGRDDPCARENLIYLLQCRMKYDAKREASHELIDLVEARWRRPRELSPRAAVSLRRTRWRRLVEDARDSVRRVQRIESFILAGVHN